MSPTDSNPPLTFPSKLVKVPIHWALLVLLRSKRFRTFTERRRHRATAERAIRDRTPPAFLTVNRQNISGGVGWAIPAGLPDPPARGLDPYSFSPADAEYAQVWIEDRNLLTDELLAARLDGFSDQIGRVSEALRCRIELAKERSPGSARFIGTRILFDGRSLQIEQYATRGIGRYAEALLAAILGEADPGQVDIFIDLRLRDIPENISAGARLVSSIIDPDQYHLFVEPSPMTSSPLPLIPVLMAAPQSIAVAHDVIPLHYPDHYLPDTAAVAEYVACLDSLGHFTELLCNSNSTAAEVMKVLDSRDQNESRSGGNGSQDRRATVAWPRFIADLMQPVGAKEPPVLATDSPIVIVAGDDSRKNLIGGLAAVGLATTGVDRPPIVVVGMAGHGAQVHHSAIASGLRPDEAISSPRLSDAEMFDLFSRASLVIIPSRDEGLSLPVIEAAECGAPVVLSNIPAHRELMGDGAFLAPAGNLDALTQAIRRVRGDKALAARQKAHVRSHRHEILEDWIGRQLRHLPRPGPDRAPATSEPKRKHELLRVAFATPWPPQHSGVADFSGATASAIAQLCDLTLVTTREVANPPGGVRWMHVNDLERRCEDFDHIVLVLGNSSLHLPFFELLNRVRASVLSHDTRFVEFYAALRGGGVEPLLLLTKDEFAPTRINPPLSQQLVDMRLIQNHAYWEVARQAERILVHTPTAVDRLERETGVRAKVLPFANYRTPDPYELTQVFREEARARLKFDRHPSNTLHLASFGFIDTRTKMADVVLESAIWLSDWGHRVSLSLVGEAEYRVQQQLEERARDSGLYDFRITGYTDEEEYRDYLAAVDLGVQLRISPLLGVAGALSDLAARGRVAVASRGVSQDVGTPDFIDRLPDAVSPITVAKAIEHRWTNMPDPAQVEKMRNEYLEQTSPLRYAEHFVAALGDLKANR